MSKAIIQKWLSRADIQIDGRRPWDIRVFNENFYDRLLAEGSLGAGEAYMEGWWECERIDEMFTRIFQTQLDQEFRSWRHAVDHLKARLFNRQKKSRAFANASHHYDIGNDLYERMLDKRMIYSCAYWKDAEDLDRAQEKKMDLICQKVGLQPGMSLLDIGCGWGGFVKYVAERYDIRAVGITVSKNQEEVARKRCEGLPVEIRLQDYRELKERFDRIISIGMFEHVGFKNYRTFMEVAHRCLKDHGLFLLHTIGSNVSSTKLDPWMDRYIFPNALLPSIKQIGKAVEGLFVMEDWHNFGPYYDRTLMAWYKNFQDHWEELRPRYDEIFYRMWKYYLLSCAGTFRARVNQLWQIVLSKRGASVERIR